MARFFARQVELVLTTLAPGGVALFPIPMPNPGRRLFAGDSGNRSSFLRGLAERFPDARFTRRVCTDYCAGCGIDFVAVRRNYGNRGDRNCVRA